MGDGCPFEGCYLTYPHAHDTGSGRFYDFRSVPTERDEIALRFAVAWCASEGIVSGAMANAYLAADAFIFERTRQRGKK